MRINIGQILLEPFWVLRPKNESKTLPKMFEQVFSLLKPYSKAYSLSRMGELRTHEAPNPQDLALNPKHVLSLHVWDTWQKKKTFSN